MEHCSTVMLSVLRLPQPVIAAVEAIAAGGRMRTRRRPATSRWPPTAAQVLHAGRAYRLVLLTPMVALWRRSWRASTPWRCCSPGDMISAEDAHTHRARQPGGRAGSPRGRRRSSSPRKIAANSAASGRNSARKRSIEQLEMRHRGGLRARDRSHGQKHDGSVTPKKALPLSLEKRQPTWEEG